MADNVAMFPAVLTKATYATVVLVVIVSGCSCLPVLLSHSLLTHEETRLEISVGSGGLVGGWG